MWISQENQRKSSASPRHPLRFRNCRPSGSFRLRISSRWRPALCTTVVMSTQRMADEAEKESLRNVGPHVSIGPAWLDHHTPINSNSNHVKSFFFMVELHIYIYYMKIVRISNLVHKNCKNAVKSYDNSEYTIWNVPVPARASPVSANKEGALVRPTQASVQIPRDSVRDSQGFWKDKWR